MTTDNMRRALLIAAGTGLGFAATRLNFGGSSRLNETSEESLSALLSSMNETQRAHTFKDPQHPARQITNTIAVHTGPHIGTLFNHQQQDRIRNIYRSMLSENGLKMFHDTVNLEGKFTASNFTIYGKNSTPLSELQIQINGGHYMLRKGNEEQSGYAFGGPISYGQQIGNGRFMVEGNAFKAHGDALHQFHKLLSQEERQQAYLTTPPSELDIQPLGESELIPGLAIGTTSKEARHAAKVLLDRIFDAYDKKQTAAAWAALNEHGGLDEVRISMFTDFGFYKNGGSYSQSSYSQKTDSQNANPSDLPYIQVWRLEGPNSVIHFKGYPHVHAYINILSKPEKRNIGKHLTHIPRSLQGRDIQRLWQSALTHHTGLSLGFYSAKPNGRLPEGDVSTGSVYAIEPFNNKVVVIDVNVSLLNSAARVSLNEQGVDLNNQGKLRIATYDYILKATDEIGLSENVIDQVVKHGPSLRSVMIEYLAQSKQIPSMA